MNKKDKQQNLFLSLTVLFLVMAAIGCTFYLTYRWDNKYTFSSDAPIRVLADNWEFYPDYKLTPSNDGSISFPESAGESHTITIGQFGTFEKMNKAASPFGNAVYRKQLFLEPSSEGWLLELPEIFSACTVYVNGECVRDYGTSLNGNHQIFIKNTLLSLPDKNVDIVIQATNYSHYYSGLVYPPLLGESDAILSTIICRLIFYAFLCFFTLGCALVSFTVWFRKQADSLYVAYGFLCLAFAVHVSYPLVHWIGLNAGAFSYVIEDTAYFVILTCISILTFRLCHTVGPRTLHLVFYAFSVILTLFPAVAFYIIFPAFPKFVSVYGLIMGCSKICISLYLILAAFFSVLINRQHIWLLSGNAVLGLGILVDYFMAGAFEPVRFGWPIEYCGFFMVLLFTGLILDYNRKALNEREHLTRNLQGEVERKTAYLTSMMEERKQFLSSVAHDLKAPVAAINTYIDYIRNSGSDSDQELAYYLDIIDHKSSQIQDNVESLQLFHSQDGGKEKAGLIDCNDFLQCVYDETSPYADANGIYFKLEIPENSCNIYGKRGNLFRAFENLILNAAEHTALEGSITIQASYSADIARITVTDNGEGISPENLSKIFDYEFSTRETKGLNGLGLYFAKITIEEYGGTISVQSQPNSSTTFTITFTTILH